MRANRTSGVRWNAGSLDYWTKRIHSPAGRVMQFETPTLFVRDLRVGLLGPAVSPSSVRSGLHQEHPFLLLLSPLPLVQ